MHPFPSKDSLSIIEADECRQSSRDLTAQRFRSCFNEIKRLREALVEIGEIASRKGPPDHVRALNVIEGRAKDVNAILRLVKSMTDDGDTQLSIITVALVTACRSCGVEREMAMSVIREAFDDERKLVPLDENFS